jgi:hypothetical protein
MTDDLVTYESLEGFVEEWRLGEPFQHIVLPNFLVDDVAKAVASEFPSYNSEYWKGYNNALENKKLLNHWDKFGPTTYRIFQYLNSPKFISKIESLVGYDLFPDYGLNGGGLHIHQQGGKLNVHLDYALHPKLRLERRLNLIVYVTPDWDEEWGGCLGFWEKHQFEEGPGRLAKKIVPVFNSAVLFDTTQNSWHGLPDPICCPVDKTRNSLAVYYLCCPRDGVSERGKALFAPYENQRNDPKVLELIKQRSSVIRASSVYGDKD